MSFRECFEYALRERGVDATEVIFFDDAIANVLARKRSGLHAIHG